MLQENIYALSTMIDMNPGYWIVSIPSVLATPWGKESEMRISIVHEKGQIVLLGNRIPNHKPSASVQYCSRYSCFYLQFF